MEFIDHWKGSIKGYFTNFQKPKEDLYLAISLMTAAPLVAALDNPAQFGTATGALLEIVSSLGAGLFRSKLNEWLSNKKKTEKELLALIQKDLQTDKNFRDEFDNLIQKLETIDIAEETLTEKDKEWFHTELCNALPHGSLRNFYMQKESYFKCLVVNNLLVNPDHASLIEAYYRSLSKACQQLPLGILDKQFIDTSNGNTIELKDVYTDVDVLNSLREESESDHKYGWCLANAESKERVSLMEGITQKNKPHIVLLGDAGSGKSAFVNYLTYLILDKQKELPECLQDYPVIKIILRDTTKYLSKDKHYGKAEMLWSVIKDDFISVLGRESGIPAFKEWMTAICKQPCLLLLDGLDEVPQSNQRRQCLLTAITDLISCLDQNSRVIVTARPYAYVQKDWNFMKFQSLVLAPFNREQINNFVTSWYAAIQGKGNDWNSSFLLSRQKDLLNAVFDDNRTYLGDLATQPVLLTLMATLHASYGELPEDRAELYENAVDLLIKRWQRQWITNTDLQSADSLDDIIRNALLLGENNLRKGLEKVAYQAHIKQQKQKNGGTETGDKLKSSEITRGELLEIFSLLFRTVNPLDLIEYIEKRAGLLYAREDGIFIFPHRTFQEFLSACYILNYSNDYSLELTQLLEEDYEWWREVYLLSVGRLKARMESSAINLITTYLPQSITDKKQNGINEQDWRKAVLAGEALLELRLIDEPDFVQNYNYLIQRIRDWLTKLVQKGKLEPKERLHAGDVLGNIGDFRKGVNIITNNNLVYPDIEWVKIPEGEFLMGSSDEDKDAYSDEKEQHSLYLPEFWISRYPVTNAQFGPFIRAKGYENPEWWTDEGWNWRIGKNSDLSGIKDKKIRNIYEPVLKRQLQEQRNQPYWYEDALWNGNNRPVVGITWFEAFAYIQWLTTLVNEHQLFNNFCKGNLKILLPSEAEWEKAFRGNDGKIFPWANNWKKDAANTREIQLSTTSIVGMFPKGKSKPLGLLDGTGNVWEWTRTIWGSDPKEPKFAYKYQTDDGREDMNSWEFRILRGGAWGSRQGNVRCTSRNRNLPDFSNYDIGFRMILSYSSDTQP